MNWMPSVQGLFPTVCEKSLFSCTMPLTHTIFMSITSKSFWGTGDDKYPNGVASFLQTTDNGGVSIKCLYVTAGVEYRTGGGGSGWASGWGVG